MQESKVNIVFNDNGPLSAGSTRIWIYNLYYWFSQLGYDIDLNNWDQYYNYDVAIFGKNINAQELQKAKAQNSRIICGCINPSDYTSNLRKNLKLSDFLIVGSILEKDYYCQYSNNTFLFPLIERIFNKVKVHENHDPIVLGYHGNLDHLNHFHPFLKAALEILDKEIPIKLIVVYNKKGLGSWDNERPNIEIEEVQWEIGTIQEQLLRCDIGLVPGLTPINLREKKMILSFLKWTQRKFVSYKHDYLIRFKNTTNSGRSFVFHQLGIPVVSDLLPTSFHILGDPKCGHLAHSTEGWLSALRDLCESAKKRQEMAQNALNEFHRLYDPLEWSKRLYNDIENLWQAFRDTPASNKPSIK